MAGQTLGLVKAYRIENSGGVAKFACVVQGAADGNCKLPTAQGVGGFVGVTTEAQPNQYKGVAVAKTGIFDVIAGGTITRGDRLAINSSAGDVYSVEAAIDAAPGTAAVFHIVGIAETSAVSGDQFPMFITVGAQVNQAAS